MDQVTRRWECRYSSCEMMYLEVNDDGTEVHMYLDHSPARGDRWTGDEALRDEIGGEAKMLFDDEVFRQLKAAVLSLRANPIHPETEAEKQAKREARRREPWPPKKDPP
jgi:hypothetical protein